MGEYDDETRPPSTEASKRVPTMQPTKGIEVCEKFVWRERLGVASTEMSHRRRMLGVLV